MKSLLIEATENSPKVDFNTANNIFEISGYSRPENPAKFYDYLIQWVEHYGEELSWKKANQKMQDRIILKVKLEYYNSTSSKYILILLDKFNSIQKNYVIPVDINWYYDEQDEGMKESGEEYAKMLPNAKFHLIANPQINN